MGAAQGRGTGAGGAAGAGGGGAGRGPAGRTRAAAVRRWGVRLAPAVVSVALGLLALGPVLGPGFALRYDMVFVPDPPLSAASLGGGSGFARAVPSDAVVAVLAKVLPADVVQALALLAVFAVGGAGAARLVPDGGRSESGAWTTGAQGESGATRAAAAARSAGLAWTARAAQSAWTARSAWMTGAARTAAAVLYVWNPFVAERLLLGQWAMLLGYAGLPWVLAAVVGLGRARGLPRLITALVPAAVGGFSSVVLSALVAGPAALVRRGAGRVRALLWVVCGLVLVSLPWLIPSLSSGARTDPAAVDLFAARADGPFGAAGSLLVLGGVWNAQAVPEWYGVPVLAACRAVLAAAAVAGWVWLARGGVRAAPVFWPGLSVSAALGVGIALLGTVEPGRELLRALIGWWPGFGPLRDGQLFVAPLALLQAVGLGGALLWVQRSVREGAGGDRGDAGRDREEDAGGTGATAEGVEETGERPGHGGVEVPGEPLSSSKADSVSARPSRFRALWTVRRRSGSSATEPVGGSASGHGSARAPDPSAPTAPTPSSTSTASTASAPTPVSPTSPTSPASPANAANPARSARAAGAVVSAVLLLAPVLLLPGLAWAAAGRLAPVDYPAEWRTVQRLVDADPRPGALVSLPWSAYRGLDWAGGGRTVVVLDPAVKLFDRRVVWNDDLRVGVGGRVRTVEGEDPLARAVAPVVERGWPMRSDPAAAQRLGAAGVRYVLVDRGAARAALGTDRERPPETSPGTPNRNTLSISRGEARVVHEGAGLILFELPDRHVQGEVERLSGLEVTGWFVTVGAILWSMVVSGSNLVPVRPVRSAGMGTWKENRK